MFEEKTSSKAYLIQEIKKAVRTVPLYKVETLSWALSHYEKATSRTKIL